MKRYVYVYRKLLLTVLMDLRVQGVKYLQRPFPMGCATNISTTSLSVSMVVIVVTTLAEVPTKKYVWEDRPRIHRYWISFMFQCV